MTDLIIGFVDDVIEIAEDVDTIQVCVNASTANFVGVVEVTLKYESITAQGIYAHMSASLKSSAMQGHKEIVVL